MNCSSRANSSWVRLDTTVQNHLMTWQGEHKVGVTLSVQPGTGPWGKRRTPGSGGHG